MAMGDARVDDTRKRRPWSRRGGRSPEGDPRGGTDERHDLQRSSASAEPLVDLIGIGVQKAATSWLFTCLREHPEIRVADGLQVRKELNFFNRQWERGFDWYERSFRSGPWRNLEFSTLYFHDANVPRRIRTYNPDAKLLLALRDPVDRAYSHHRHEYARGRLPEDRLDFWAALSRNPSYVDLGLYAKHLSRWLRCFPRDQIHVVFYEQVASDPAAVLERAFRFAGVDPSFRPPSTAVRVNQATRSRIGPLNRWLRVASRGIRRTLGREIHTRLRQTGIGRVIRRHNRTKVQPSELPPLRAADRARLAEIFREENERLGRLVDEDLPSWAA